MTSQTKRKPSGCLNTTWMILPSEVDISSEPQILDVCEYQMYWFEFLSTRESGLDARAMRGNSETVELREMNEMEEWCPKNPRLGA